MGGQECLSEECRSANIELLRYVTTALNNRGVKYWLDFGALLGVIREGDMIVGDDDTDLGVSTDDLEAVEDVLAEVEDETSYSVKKSDVYRRCADFTGESLMLYQIRGEGSLLDIFFFEPDNDILRSMWTSDDDTTISTVFPVQEIYVPAWGFSVNIPADPVARLVGKYGEDYMTPKSSKARGRVTRSIKVFSRCVGNKYRRTSRSYKFLFVIVFIIGIIHAYNVIFI